VRQERANAISAIPLFFFFSSGMIRVSVRRPDGGEIVIPLHKQDRVEQLREMIQWCFQNNEWDFNAIPRQIKGKATAKHVPDDEMWSLNEQVDTRNERESLHVDADELEDLEALHARANAAMGEIIENIDSGRLEIMHGAVMLQDGCLDQYGIQDGSFLNPLYTLRGGGGADSRSWGTTVAHLPWKDREWYGECTSSALASAWSWLSSATDSASSVANRMTDDGQRAIGLHSSTSGPALPRAPSCFQNGHANEEVINKSLFAAGHDDNALL
jgi:hypothetical protein